jgi:hypothetical protein
MPFNKPHRFDAAFLVVSRDQDEQAWVGHADSVAENFRAGNLGKRVKRICSLFVFSGISTDFLRLYKTLHPEFVAGHVRGIRSHHHTQGDLIKVGAVGHKLDNDAP